MSCFNVTQKSVAAQSHSCSCSETPTNNQPKFFCTSNQIQKRCPKSGAVLAASGTEDSPALDRIVRSLDLGGLVLDGVGRHLAELFEAWAADALTAAALPPIPVPTLPPRPPRGPCGDHTPSSGTE